MSRKTLTLALQGGGSHGAFIWGVLDRLLDDELAKQESSRNRFSLGRLDRRFRQLNVHVIESPAPIGALPVQSKLNAHPSLLRMLHEDGRATAELWLHDLFSVLGRRSSSKLPAELRTH